jgi:hypothetical protein
MKYFIIILIILLLISLFIILTSTKENFNNNNKKNIIFTSAGDNTNFHNNWVGNNKNYDIWVIYYGDNDEKYNLYKNKVKFIEKINFKILIMRGINIIMN